MNFYFDMDGTLANTYAMENWLERLEKEDVSPYVDAAPLVPPQVLNPLIEKIKAKGHTVGVISWLSMDSSQKFKNATRKAKKDWLAQFFPSITNNIHLVQFGTKKHHVVRPKGAILFDDNEKVGNDWTQAGGIWVNVKGKSILEVLENVE